MGNLSFDLFVSFSISGLKENVISLNYYSFWEETQSFICFRRRSTHREWEFFFRSLQINTVNSGHNRGECCLSTVFFALSTWWHAQLLKTFDLPFFLHKLTSIYRQNWSCEEIPSSQNSDKVTSLILLCSGEHGFERIKSQLQWA